MQHVVIHRTRLTLSYTYYMGLEGRALKRHNCACLCSATAALPWLFQMLWIPRVLHDCVNVERTASEITAACHIHCRTCRGPSLHSLNRTCCRPRQSRRAAVAAGVAVAVAASASCPRVLATRCRSPHRGPRLMCETAARTDPSCAIREHRHEIVRCSASEPDPQQSQRA